MTTKPALAAATPTAFEAPVEPHYDSYYNRAPPPPHHQYNQHHNRHSSSSSSSSTYPPRYHHSHHSPLSHPHESFPRQQHYTSSAYPTEQSYPSQQQQQQQQRHRQYQQEQEREHAHHPHPSNEYLSKQQQHEYPPEPSSSYNRPSYYKDHDDRRPYHSYPHHYPSNASSPSQPEVRHTEGYHGRVRNTNRDQNDHLMTTDPHSNSHDQQQYDDQYRRDSSSGYLNHMSQQQRTLDEDINKFHLPPILAPEEPFYRKDLPGRHMRYFRNVTSQDREDRHGYYSSARHVAPSNTTGNFGHGPPIGDVLDRFGARQAQQQRQQQLQQQQQQQQQHHEQQHEQQDLSEGPRLPSLYTALPDQRPFTRSESNASEGSSPSHVAAAAHSPQQHRPMYLQRSRSPVQYQQQHSYQQQQQMAVPQAAKPKTIQPRTIAPAPLSNPTSPVVSQPMDSPRVGAKRSDRQMFVKIEPRDQPSHYASQMQSQHRPLAPPSRSAAKRKWDREHSPTRQGSRSETTVSPRESAVNPNDDSSQELHLFSRRSHFAHTTRASVRGLSSPTTMTHSKQKVQRYQMTTIRCWHGAIAQKSYGIEKRYLCPPPMVQVSAGVNANQVRTEQPHVTMTVIHEKVHGPNAENLMEQDCSLDDSLRCSFRNLHVTGTGSDSSKRFKLGLQVFLNKHTTIPTAVMGSNPIPIISKPSKKTAKAGNASCFILNGMSVSLLNRINAQTVRTKYMAVDNNSVCAKIGSWSSFTIKMVKPPPAPQVKTVPANMGVFKAPGHSTKFVPIRMKGEPTSSAPTNLGSSMSMNGSLSNQARSEVMSATVNSSSFQFRHPQQLQNEPVYTFSNSEPVLYGSEIVLINDLTGIMTDRLIIRKVENGKVSRSGTGPVSQMQKIVLEHPDRVHPEDGRAYYLSASSIGSPKIEGKIPLQAAMDRSPLLEYRTSSKKASIMDMTDAHDENEDELIEEDGGYSGQTNSMPRRLGRTHDSVAVDDFVCWTIAGIAKFEYNYFSSIPTSVDTDVDPSKVPTLLASPQYNPQTNTMIMPVKNIFEKLTAEEEACLAKHQDDPYERKLTLSEYVYKRCEDVRQPMRDEEGPIQLWLAQHGPIRMRRRPLNEVTTDEELIREAEMQQQNADESSESETDESEQVMDKAKSKGPGDRLPKIATKTNNSIVADAKLTTAPLMNAANGRYYGGSHLPASALQRQRKMVKGPMGLEAELPYGSEVHAAIDSQGNAKVELDLLMVERASGIAYRTGYKIVYSRERERSEWAVEVVG
ncbi:hypothetical protein BGZ50_002368 [Haplosporangium sp. Z 11]|nr:hypothetical protein BGZ50_002368 [Haplosporangium sp. Z 11]